MDTVSYLDPDLSSYCDLDPNGHASALKVFTNMHLMHAGPKRVVRDLGSSSYSALSVQCDRGHTNGRIAITQRKRDVINMHYDFIN